MATKKKPAPEQEKKITAVLPEWECSVFLNEKKPSDETEIIRILVGKGLPKCIDAKEFMRHVCEFVTVLIALKMDEYKNGKKGKKCNDCGKKVPSKGGVTEKQILALRERGLSIKAIAKELHKSDRFVAKVVKGAYK